MRTTTKIHSFRLRHKTLPYQPVTWEKGYYLALIQILKNFKDYTHKNLFPAIYYPPRDTTKSVSC